MVTVASGPRGTFPSKPNDFSDEGIQKKNVSKLVGQMLDELEVKPRGGILDTPDRYAAAMQFWLSGYKQDPIKVLKTFEDGAQSYDELVFCGAIPLFSLCEHHLTPFFGIAHIGYIPSGKIVGLSKLARLTDIFARRLQVQERLTREIAETLQNALKPIGVGVVLRCRHLCMESRGVHKPGTLTYTSALFGAFKEKPEARAEFLEFVKRADQQAGHI